LPDEAFNCERQAGRRDVGDRPRRPNIKAGRRIAYFRLEAVASIQRTPSSRKRPDISSESACAMRRRLFAFLNTFRGGLPYCGASSAPGSTPPSTHCAAIPTSATFSMRSADLRIGMPGRRACDPAQGGWRYRPDRAPCHAPRRTDQPLRPHSGLRRKPPMA